MTGALYAPGSGRLPLQMQSHKSSIPLGRRLRFEIVCLDLVSAVLPPFPVSFLTTFLSLLADVGPLGAWVRRRPFSSFSGSAEILLSQVKVHPCLHRKRLRVLFSTLRAGSKPSFLVFASWDPSASYF